MPLIVRRHFCVLWKTEAVSLLKAADAAEKISNCKKHVLITIMLMHMKNVHIIQEKEKINWIMWKNTTEKLLKMIEQNHMRLVFIVSKILGNFNEI